jgi:hypothetical protein
MANIGERIARYYASNTGDFKSPTLALEQIVNKMSEDLRAYKARGTANEYVLQQKTELLKSLFEILQTIKRLEPLDVWAELSEKIADQCLMSEQADVALIYLPLKANIQPYANNKIGIIDMAGFNFENEYEYSLHGNIHAH